MVPATPRAGLLPAAVLVGAQFAIGAAALMARAGLGAGLSPLSLTAWRLTLAGLIVLAIRSGARTVPKRTTPLSARDRAVLVGAGCCLAFHFAAWFASLQTISVARSTLLVTTAPLWAGLGGVLFLRHRLSRRFWIGLAIAAAGATLMTGGWGAVIVHHGTRESTITGDLLAILGAIAVAAYLLVTQPLQSSLGTATVVAWTYPSAALWTWAWIAIQGSPNLWPPSPAAWLAVAGMAVVPQLIGHTALNWSLRHFPAGVVAAATLLEPVFAGALAWMLLNESLTAIQVAGGVVMLGGVALTLRQDAPNKRSARDEKSAAD